MLILTLYSTLMELRHLKTFQTITETGSFSVAAEKLQYAQSTITLHMQQLESELKVQLFSRHGRKLQLTTAGRALQEHVNQLLYRAAELQQTMTDLVAGEAGHLRIGCIEPVASLYLPDILIEFCQKHPKVRLTLEMGITQTVSQRVAKGELDLAICSSPPAHLGLTFEALFTDPIILILPRSHALSKKDLITIQDLAGERILLTEQNCPYRELLERTFSAHGINPYSGLEIISMEAIKRMVAGGLGIGLISAAFKDLLPEEIVAKSVENLELELLIGIAHEPERSLPGRALELLIAALRTNLRNKAG